METKRDKIDSFIGRINKKCAGGMASSVGACNAVRIVRIPSGSLELDLALGGGYPKGRMILLYGPPSSGKTTLIVKACVSIESFCFICGCTLQKCKCAEGMTGYALIVDSEGAFDVNWASKNGFNADRHTIFRPAFGEQAVDVIDTAIREKVFDLIVLDSIAMTVPAKELEKSAEDDIIGRHAMMMNRAFRKWTNAMVQMGNEAPTLLCINQPREKVGVMYGDNMTLPGGRGQQFSSSVELRLKGSKVHDEAGSVSQAYVEISGTVAKNKTYIPKLEFSFQLGLQDYDGLRAGEINNAEVAVKHCRQLDLIKCGGGKWFFDMNGERIEAKGKDEILQLLRENPDILNFLDAVVRERKIIR